MESTLQIVITQLDVSCLVARTQGALRKKNGIVTTWNSIYKSYKNYGTVPVIPVSQKL